MAKLTPEQLHDYNNALHQLSNSKGVYKELPNLVQEKGPLEELWNRVLHWLGDYFNFEPVSKSVWHLSWIFTAVKFLVILLVITLLGLCLYLLVRYFKNRSKTNIKTASATPKVKKIISREEHVISTIEQALGLKEFQRACRLRWKLFLKRFQEKAFLTPLEWQQRHAITLQMQNFPWPQAPNEMMFGKLHQGLQTYQNLDQRLTELENRFLKK